MLPPKLSYTLGDLPVQDLPLPEKTVLFVKREGNAPVRLGVKAGDQVKGGDCITSPRSARVVVSPVTGTVSDIYDVDWTGGEAFVAVAIETSKVDEWGGAGSAPADPFAAEPRETVSLLGKCGFDVSALEGPEKLDTVVVSALDSDLFATANQQILRERAEAVKTGIRLLKRLAGTERVLLAVPLEPGGAPVDALAGEATVCPVRGEHPNGVPGILLRILARKTGGLGRYMFLDTERLAAMADCAEAGRPFTDKVVTLVPKNGGPARNLRVREGTPVFHIVEQCGVELSAGDRIVLGGPMMGRAAYSTDFPVMRDTDAVLIQDGSEADSITGSQCINCGKCVSVCPVNLQVNLLARYSEFSLFDKCAALEVDFCVECGVCAYVCTAGRPLVQFIQLALSELERNKEEETEQ